MGRCRRGDRRHRRARRAARAGCCGQDRHFAAGHRCAGLFRPAGPDRRHLAIKEINAAGGIKALGGARNRDGVRRCAIDTGRRHAEVERMHADGVAAIVGGFASPICLAATPGGRALRPALHRRCRRLRPDRHARPEEHLPLRAGLRHHHARARSTISSPSTMPPASRPRRWCWCTRTGLFGSGLAKLMQRAAAQARLRGAGDHRASDAGARHVERGAADPRQEPRSRHSVELLRRVRAARAHHAAAAHPAEGHLFGAQRRGVQSPLRQGVPGSRPVRHGLQSLARPAQRRGAGPEERGRGVRATSAPTTSP